MTEISHFLEPGGWRVTRTASGCATMFPKSGRILIGRGEAEGEQHGFHRESGGDREILPEQDLMRLCRQHEEIAVHAVHAAGPAQGTVGVTSTAGGFGDTETNLGAGVTASITINGRVYSYTTVDGDTALTVRDQLMALINAGAGDPDVIASPDQEGFFSARATVEFAGEIQAGDSVTITAVERGPHHLKISRGGHELWSDDVAIEMAGQQLSLRFEPPTPTNARCSNDTSTRRRRSRRRSTSCCGPRTW